MEQTAIKFRTREIKVNGKDYMCITVFAQEFRYGSNSQIYRLIQEGLPCINMAGRWWFNKEDCHRWFAGEG